jgi:phosphoglycerate kinase
MIKTIKDLVPLSGKKVFIRCDFNVALSDESDEKRSITDDTRIRAALPTIEFARKNEAKVILASHLGRPKGKADAKWSLLPVAERLSELLDCDVLFPDHCVGEGPRKLVRDLEPGQVLLLENLRFHPGESKNDREFAQKLKDFCDIYINDAFGTMHREHASVAALPQLMSQRGMGFLVEKEIKYLSKLLSDPEHPFLAILGGNKISDKISVIRNLLPRVDTLLIVGGMAYTFLKQKGMPIGKSVVENDRLELTKELQSLAHDKRTHLLLPSDHIIADRFDKDAHVRTVRNEDGIPEGWMGLDIGPKTIVRYKEQIQKAKTIFWNGPAGVFEMEPFRNGTLELAKSVAKSKAVSVIGGGDSVAAIKLLKLEEEMSLISTGGGATLEYLSKKTLPGIKCLES